MKTLIVLGVVGAIAQLIDGSLGMAYGVTSTTLLVAAGIAPAAASASVHFAEIGTTLASGVSHHKLGNVDWRIVRILAIPGALGFIIHGWGKADLPPFSLGHVNLAGFVLIAASSMLFAPLGARAAHALEPKWLRRLFGVFLAVTSIKMMT